MSTAGEPAADGGRVYQDDEAVPTADEVQSKVAADVPYGLTVAAGWSWRVLLVLIMAGAAVWLFSHISILVIPLLIAALLATLLHPMHAQMLRLRIPAVLSALMCIVFLLALVIGLMTLAGQQLVVGFADMSGRVIEGVNGLIAWVQSFGITTDQWTSVLDDLINAARNNSQAIVSGALGFGTTAGNIVAGIVMALFALIFFLLDGNRIWTFLLNFVPRRHRRALDGAGRAGWSSLGSYVRVQIFVAFIDAVGIGFGAYLLNVPLAMPLGVLVFLGAFIPIVGAVLTGAVAVILALMANGPVNALLMLLVVLAVQQIESSILQPLVMGKAVRMHPLAVFLAVAAGTSVLGLVGAVFAVPVMAFVNAAVRYLSARPWEQHRGEAAGIPVDENTDSTFRERAAALEDRFLPQLRYVRKRGSTDDGVDEGGADEPDAAYQTSQTDQTDQTDTTNTTKTEGERP